MEKGKNKKVIAAGLLVMSLTMACNSALAPILAEVGKFFPDASDSAIQIVLTLINLTTLPMMFLEPFMESRITKRDIAVIGTVLMLIGGLMPQVLNTQLWMLYAASIVIGAGLSLVVVVSSSLISDYFTGIEKSRVMGFQSIFVSIGGTLIAKGSGLFTAMAGWKRGIPDLHSDHPDRHADGAERRSASEDREGQIRHLREHGILWSAMPDYRYFCCNFQYQHCYVY